MDIRVLFIYINILLLTLVLTSFSSLFGMPPASFAPYTVLSCLSLLVFLKEIIKSHFFPFIAIYAIVLVYNCLVVKEPHYSTISLFIIPLLLCLIEYELNSDNRKILLRFFVFVFLANAIVAYIERIIGFWIVPIDPNNYVLQGQMLEDKMDITSFRAFAFFGHPLTNGNVMAYMSFIILFTEYFSFKKRVVLFLIGISSLFCFNSRGALLVSGALLFPTLIILLKNVGKNHRLKFLSFLIVIAIIVIINFDSFGGRLVTGDLNDRNTEVRLAAIREFLSYSLDSLLIGGISMKNGENGYLMTLAYYGLVAGTIKIALEIYFSYKMINVKSKWVRFIIMSALIIVGSTNNNLYYSVVFPWYILFVTFVINNSNPHAATRYVTP